MDKLASFGVVSLYTQVLTDLAIWVSQNTLENDPSLPDQTTLSVDDITSLLTLCLNTTFLAFENQVHRTAMGSPMLVVVANLVMEKVEEKALATFTLAPCFWVHYVDETCAALPD